MFACILYALLARYSGGDVQFRGTALAFDEGFVGEYQRRARRQHGVYQQQGLAGEVARRYVFHPDVERAVLAVAPVGRYEGARGVVEVVEESLMERDAGAEDGGEHDLFVGQHHLGLAERGFHLLRRVAEAFADFVSHHLAHPFQVAAEAHAVFLNAGIADLRDEAVENRVLLVKYMHHNRLSLSGVYGNGGGAGLPPVCSCVGLPTVRAGLPGRRGVRSRQYKKLLNG